MTVFEGLVFLGLGLIGGGLSGLLGIGGGIVMVPLLLYVPPALGVAAMGMKIVAGITTVQSFAGAASGAFGHGRFNRVHSGLVMWLGLPMALACLIASRLSAHVSEQAMLVIFAAMAAVAAIMMLVPKKDAAHEETVEETQFNRSLAVAIGLIIGALSGVIGQGGGFLYVPAMLLLLGVPTRIAIGSALGVGILSSGAVLVGRLGTNQIPWDAAALVVVGVVLGAQFGALLSQRTPRTLLRRVLALVIMATAIKIGLGVFESPPPVKADETIETDRALVQS